MEIRFARWSMLGTACFPWSPCKQEGRRYSPRCLTPSPIASFIEGVQVFMTCGALMTELRKYDLIYGQKLGKECVMWIPHVGVLIECCLLWARTRQNGYTLWTIGWTLRVMPRSLISYPSSISSHHGYSSLGNSWCFLILSNMSILLGGNFRGW